MYLFQLIETGESSCMLTGTKIEVKMRKAEPGHWSKLDIPRPVRLLFTAV